VPKDLVERVNLDAFYPPFLERLLAVLAACRARGADYYVVSGFRSFAEQAKLYAQGRTQPGKKVTDAPPGFSGHQYGIAVDVVRDVDLDRPKLQPGWDPALYNTWQECLVAAGLKRGPKWDHGHCELDVKALGFSWDTLKRIHNEKGLRAVWDALSAVGT
jgi:peptidoglycan L-alanyl-D-glutamate endopeptidase CwlK